MWIKAELSFSPKKYELTQPIKLIKNGILHVEEKNSYLTLPVLFTLKKGDNILNSFLSFGPEFSFLVSQDRTLKASSNGYELFANTYYDFETNAVDYGLALGGGFQTTRWIVDARFFLSLNPLYKGENALQMRYMNLFLNLGYVINYQKPTSYSRTNAWKRLKYKIKHIF